MADEDDRKWLPPNDPDDKDTLPGVPGSFSGGPDVPGSGPSEGSGLSSGDPLGGGGGGSSSGGGLWSSPQPSSGGSEPPGPWGPPGQGQGRQPSPPQPGGWGPPPAQQQTLPPYQQAGDNNGKATTALVLGIVGLVACPIICSVLALIFGYQARGEIDRSDGRQSGRGQATAGIILGWIGLIIFGLGLILFFIGAVLLGEDSTDGDFDEIGRPAVIVATLTRAAALLPL